ncbi:MJ0042-type zinc finger domain-containing protein [Flavobacterium psychrophilum]|uniref:MJ0042-type zinc finger domain-containing protein n=1 Tax=Flavobacterium psychrophilum TaxID=96345 RepID=UPI003B434341
MLSFPKNRNRSNTKCPHCQSTTFEVVNDEPIGIDYELRYLRCKSCNTFLDVVYIDTTSLLVRKIAEHLKINLEDKLFY